MTWEDYDQVPGWPTKATRVYPATERIGPRLVREERRQECREANEKWLSEMANREKARAAKAAYKRRLRELKTSIAEAKKTLNRLGSAA